MENPDVMVIGRCCVDHIAVVERMPVENQKAPLDVMIVEGGGQGGTSSCCISKLGGNVSYLGRVGSDPEGRYCLQRLEDFGVETRWVDVVADGKTPVAFVFVTRENGNRTIIYERNRLPKLTLNDIRPGLATRPKVLLLDPEVTYLAESMIGSTENASRIVYDAERWREGVTDMMATADFFIPTETFLSEKPLGFRHMSLEEKMAALNARTRGILVVTRGAKGADYIFEAKAYHVDAPEVLVKDTTGAGDNFHAAFALSVSRGEDIHRAVRFSVAVATMSCTAYGGRNGIPDMAAALEMSDQLRTIAAGDG